jgi:hypothetical protein
MEIQPKSNDNKFGILSPIIHRTWFKNIHGPWYRNIENATAA